MDTQHLNDKQKLAFKQLKEAVSDCKLVDSSDAYLLKWLTARNFDATDAEKMLRTSLDWRRLNQIDGMLANWTPPEAMVRYYPVGMSGQDKYGCPVWVHAFGRTDFRGLISSVGKKDFLRYVTMNNEIGLVELNRLRALNGRIVTQHTLIMDMEHMSMKTLTYRPGMEVQVEAIKNVEENYPDNYRRVYVINAPKIFTIFFPMIKPFIGPVTLNKFRVYGCDEKQWKAALLEDIDADQLPVHYGGTLADPDGNPMYLTKVCMGGEVPKTYYAAKGRAQPTAAMEPLLLPRGAKKRLEFNIPVPNSIIRWEFLSEEGDVGFGICYQSNEPQESPEAARVDLLPSSRVDCHVVPEEGRIDCPKAATYIVEFDNSFSYWRSKKLWYDIEVLAPSSE